jgi:hypothetical protein
MTTKSQASKIRSGMQGVKKSRINFGIFRCKSTNKKMPAGAEKQFVINFLEGMKEVSGDDAAR